MTSGRALKVAVAVALMVMLAGCNTYGYLRVDDFVKTPELRWRSQSSLRPGYDDLATGYHFVPGKGLSLHNWMIVSPVAFNTGFSMSIDFELDCRPSGAVDEHWDGFFVMMVNVLQVPCIGQDYIVPAACPPPKDLAFVFMRNNPVEKPTEPHVITVHKGDQRLLKTAETGVVMDGANELTLRWSGGLLNIEVNGHLLYSFALELPQGDLIGLQMMADSGHYESTLPPDGEGNPRMPSDVMYIRNIKLQGYRGGVYYVPSNFYFDHTSEL